MHDGPREEAQHHHDGRGVDQHPTGVQADVPHLGSHQVGDPAVGAELRRGQREHHEQQQEEERLSQGLDEEAEGGAGDGGGDPSVAGLDAEHATELREHEAEHDERAERPELAQHVDVADAGGHALLHGEAHARQHEPVGDGGREDQPELGRPIHVLQGNRHHPAEHEATRPSRVQDVQPLGLLAAEHGGHDGIDDGFHRAVAQGHDEVRPVQIPVALGPHGHDDGHEVAQEGEDHGLAVAHLVDHQAEQHDRDGEGPQAGAEDLALLRLAQGELHAPFLERHGAQDEAEGGRDQSHEAAEEQQPIVRRGRVALLGDDRGGHASVSGGGGSLGAAWRTGPRRHA